MGLLNNDAAWSGEPFLDSVRMQAEAAGVGFDWPDVSNVLEKLREEVAELDAAIAAKDNAAAMHELGDVFLASVNIARLLQLNPNSVMQTANERFRDRFVLMRTLIEDAGRSLEECTLAELDRAWDEAKRADHSK